MKSSKKLAQFIAKSCTTLCVNEKIGYYYVEVPVSDYEELSIFKMNILTAIELIIDHREDMEDQHYGAEPLRTLIHLLRAFDLHEECMGMAKLLKAQVIK